MVEKTLVSRCSSSKMDFKMSGVIHSGASIRHLCRSFNANANHIGTSVGKLEVNGPKSPFKKFNTLELKLGTMEMFSSSACVELCLWCVGCCNEKKKIKKKYVLELDVQLEGFGF